MEPSPQFTHSFEEVVKFNQIFLKVFKNVCEDDVIYNPVFDSLSLFNLIKIIANIRKDLEVQKKYALLQTLFSKDYFHHFGLYLVQSKELDGNWECDDLLSENMTDMGFHTFSFPEKSPMVHIWIRDWIKKHNTDGNSIIDIENLIQYLIGEYLHVIITKTCIDCEWSTPFQNTMSLPFINQSESKKIPMMYIRGVTNVPTTSMDFGNLTCSIFGFQYTNKIHMLVIMPNQETPCTKSELNEQIIPSMSNISDWTKKKMTTKTFNGVYMPKFHIEQKHDLNLKKLKECSEEFKSFIFDNIVDLDMKLVPTDSIYIGNICSMKNMENGTIRDYKKNRNKKKRHLLITNSSIKSLILNKPFVYSLVDDDTGLILKVGIFEKGLSQIPYL